MDAEARYLDTLAATQIIGDTEVARCWELVREGIQTYKIGLGNLGNLIEHLRAGNGMGVDELCIEVLLDDPDRALVALLDDERTCPAPALITELERLLERAGGKASNSSSPSPAGTPSPGDPLPGGAAPGRQAAGELDLLGILAGILGTTPARLAGDPDAYRAQVERVRGATAALAAAVSDPGSDDATRMAAAVQLRQVLAESAQAGGTTARARTADLAGTITALGIDVDRFTAALRTVTDWLQERTPAAGAAVDRMIVALDKAVGPLLGSVDQAVLDAQRDSRARTAARAAITNRLRKGPEST